MSQIFHKSCYTSRSSGYKYRTLSTNTGKCKRLEKEKNIYDKKFNEIRKAIIGKIDREVRETCKARESINEKFNKINAKIDSVLELQNTLASLRLDLNEAGCKLMEIVNKVERIDILSSNSFQSRKTFIKSQEPIEEERET